MLIDHISVNKKMKKKQEKWAEKEEACQAN